MYELIQSQIVGDFFQQQFPNDGQRFVAWYLRNILFRDMNEKRDTYAFPLLTRDGLTPSVRHVN